MKLYTFHRSSAAYRVRIALNLKGLAHDFEFISLPCGEQRDEAYLAANPQGLVPTLETGQGDLLTQSLAIIEYLDETHPEPALLPSNPHDRALVRAMAQVIACDMHPLNNLRILHYLRNTLAHDQETVNEWYRYWIARGFEGLEAMVASHGRKSFCFGASPGLADICLVPQVYNARRFEADLNPYPNLVRIDEYLRGLKPFSDAVPEAQRDAK